MYQQLMGVFNLESKGICKKELLHTSCLFASPGREISRTNHLCGIFAVAPAGLGSNNHHCSHRHGLSTLVK